MKTEKPRTAVIQNSHGPLLEIIMRSTLLCFFRAEYGFNDSDTKARFRIFHHIHKSSSSTG